MYPKGSKFPRPFRKILLDCGYITPGQPIPLNFKRLACKNPELAFVKAFKRAPNKKEKLMLKKLACLALERNNRNER